MASRELGPQNIEGLSIRLQKLGKVMDHASRLVEKPGGSDWPPSLQIERYSGSAFLRKLVIAGKEAQIIKNDLLPALAQTIDLTQAEKNLKEIRAFAQNGIISKELLKKAEEEFARTGLEAPSEPVARQPSEQVITTTEAPLAKKTLPSQTDTGVGEEFFKYTTRDLTDAIAKATGITEEAALSRAQKQLSMHPDIKPLRRYVSHGKGAHRIFFFTKEQMDILVAAGIEVKGRRRRTMSQQKQTPKPTNSPASQPIITDVSLPSKPVKPTAFPEEQQKQDILTLEVNGKVITVPKKEFYTTEDVAEAIGIDNFIRVRQRVFQAMKRDSSIKPHHQGKGQAHRKFFFTEEDFIKLVQATASVKPTVRRSVASPQELAQTTSALALPLKPLTLESLVANAQKQTIFVAETETPTNAPTLVARQEDFVILPNDTKIEDLNQVDSTLLQLFIDRGLEGKPVSKEELTQVYIAAGGRSRFVDEIMSIRIIPRLNDRLEETDYKIENIAPARRGVEGIYIFRKRAPEEGRFMEDQADEDKRQEITDFSPLPEIIMSPVKETPTRPETEKSRIAVKNEVTLKAIANVLSKIAARKPEDINRNIRVILGKGLSPRTTLPQVFGSEINDDDLKTSFVGDFANALERLWNKDQSPEYLSEEENQIRLLCLGLKRQTYSISSLVRDVSRHLGTLPPSKYRAS